MSNEMFESGSIMDWLGKWEVKFVDGYSYSGGLIKYVDYF